MSDELFRPKLRDAVRGYLLLMRAVLIYPEILLELPHGTARTRRLLQRLVCEDYGGNPIEYKNLGGMRAYLNPADTDFICPSIACLGYWELGTMEVLNSVVERSDVVLDIGANVGFFTLVLATCIGNDGVLLSVEPEPTNFSLLTASVKFNQLHNVRLFNGVISDRDGEAILNVEEGGNKGRHSIVHLVSQVSLVVKSWSLTTLLRDAAVSIGDLIKIDVEGAEALVLDGGWTLQGRPRFRFIVMEWDPLAWASRGGLITHLEKAYRSYPFDPSLPFLRLREVKLGGIDWACNVLLVANEPSLAGEGWCVSGGRRRVVKQTTNPPGAWHNDGHESRRTER
jgi:FkbM family methyltransferase